MSTHTQGKLEVYECTVLFDASANVEVKAASAEAAASLAMDEVEGYQRLCHQCSGSLDTGDSIGAIVYLNGELVADTTYKAEEIQRLTADRDELKAQRDELLAALKGILNECGLAGLADARDFDWPKVIGAARAAIARTEVKP